MLCWLKGWQRVSRAPKGRWPHSQTRAAGVVRASPVSGGWLAAGPEASVPGSAAHARAPSVLRRGPLDRERPRRRERTGAEGGGRPARAALGAWGRRASPPFAGATAPTRAGRAPRAYVRGPSRARAAWGTRGRRRRRASTPRAKAAASGRRGPDAPQAPGRQGAPRAAPVCTARSGGRRGHHRRGDRCRLGREPGGQAEGHPPADEEEAEPEQGEAGAPETPGTVMPSAPLVQAGRDIVKRGGGSHGSCSSLWVGAHARGPRCCPVSPS